MHKHSILALAVKVLRNCVSNVIVVSKLVAAHVDSALDVAAQEVLSAQMYPLMVFNLISGQTFVHLPALCRVDDRHVNAASRCVGICAAKQKVRHETSNDLAADIDHQRLILVGPAQSMKSMQIWHSMLLRL